MKASTLSLRKFTTGAALILLLHSPARAEDAKPAANAAPQKETKPDPRVVAKTVGIETAEKLIAKTKKLVVLDVRTEKEFAAGHLLNARNVDAHADTFKDDLARLDKSVTYLVHSAGGSGRVTKTLEIFEGLGFTNWVNLEGYKGWTNAAQPTVKR